MSTTRMRASATRAVVIMALLLLGALSGCRPEFVPNQVAPAQLKPGDTVPAVTEPAIIISGAISHTNQQETLALDISALEQLGMVQYQVDDPWLKRRATYSGVLVADLLRFAGADETASTVHVSAWDDYAADVPIEELERWSILLATRSEGQAMPMDKGGPTRLILPYQHHPDLVLARAISVWNIREIEVR